MVHWLDNPRVLVDLRLAAMLPPTGAAASSDDMQNAVLRLSVVGGGVWAAYTKSATPLLIPLGVAIAQAGAKYMGSKTLADVGRSAVSADPDEVVPRASTGGRVMQRGALQYDPPSTVMRSVPVPGRQTGKFDQFGNLTNTRHITPPVPNNVPNFRAVHSGWGPAHEGGFGGEPNTHLHGTVSKSLQRTRNM